MAKSKIATAYVQVAPSAEGIKGKLSSVFNKEMPGAGTSAGGVFGSSMMGKLKGVIAAAGIGKLLSDSIQGGADLQQSLGGIETLFKDSAGKVIKNAEQAYKTAGMSANEYMEAVTGFSASLLQGLGGDTSKAADVADMALKDMSDNANKMGSSMESIQNAYQGFAKQNYTMLDNLKLGYGGTKGEMERLLKDAQKISGVKYDLSNLSDVYEAIHVIQQNMDITGTTAKEAASTFSGSLASMKSAFSDVLANLSLGRDVGPSLSALGETVFTFLEGNLIPMVGNVLSALPKVLSEVLSTAIRGLNKVANGSDGLVRTGVELVTSLTRVILSNLPYLIEAGVGIVSALGRAILSTDWGKVVSDLMEALKDDMDLAAGEILGTDGNIVGSLIDAVVAGMPRFLETGADVVGGMIDGVVMALPEVLEAGKEVFDIWLAGVLELLPDVISTGLAIVEDLVAGIQEALPVVLDVGGSLVLELLEGLFAALPGVFEAALSLIETLVDTIITNLPQILQTGKEILMGVVSGIREALPDMLVAAADTIGTIVTGLAEHLPEILAAGFDLMISLTEGIGDAWPDIIEAAGEAAQNIWDAICQIDWIGLGKDLVNGLIAGIGSMGGALWDAAVGIGESAVGAIKDFFGIASPSKLMRDEVGRFIPAGIAVGVDANAKPLKDSLSGLADMTSGTLQAELSGRALRTAAPAAERRTGNTTFMINVYGAQGQSTEELAEVVMRKLRHEYARKEAAL